MTYNATSLADDITRIKADSCKQSAGIFGKIIATEPVLGPIVIMVAKASYAVIRKRDRKDGIRRL
jgi:hypothetical protein